MAAFLLLGNINTKSFCSSGMLQAEAEFVAVRIYFWHQVRFRLDIWGGQVSRVPEGPWKCSQLCCAWIPPTMEGRSISIWIPPTMEGRAGAARAKGSHCPSTSPPLCAWRITAATRRTNLFVPFEEPRDEVLDLLKASDVSGARISPWRMRHVTLHPQNQWCLS